MEMGSNMNQMEITTVGTLVGVKSKDMGYINLQIQRSTKESLRLTLCGGMGCFNLIMGICFRESLQIT